MPKRNVESDAIQVGVRDVRVVLISKGTKCRPNLFVERQFERLEAANCCHAELRHGILQRHAQSAPIRRFNRRHLNVVEIEASDYVPAGVEKVASRFQSNKAARAAQSLAVLVQILQQDAYKWQPRVVPEEIIIHGHKITAGRRLEVTGGALSPFPVALGISLRATVSRTGLLIHRSLKSAGPAECSRRRGSLHRPGEITLREVGRSPGRLNSLRSQTRFCPLSGRIAWPRQWQVMAVVRLNCSDYELFILAADRLNLSVFVELEGAQARHLLEDDAVGGLDSVLNAARSDGGHCLH